MLKSSMKINEKRLLADLDDLARIGATRDGGVSRTAMSSEDVLGRAWFRQQVERAGLAYCVDGAGNQSAVLHSANPQAKTLMAGSHLDTVPNGGRFDGALGVLVALEVLRTAKESGAPLPVHLEAINFTDEEGSLLSLLGSMAAAGQLPAAALEHARGGHEVLLDGMSRIGITSHSLMSARRDPRHIAGYLELHIEQGVRIEYAQASIGVVNAIVGIRSFWLQFEGRAAHAGSTPMNQRASALLGAAQFVTESHALVMKEFSPGVMNCGQLEVQPGAFNIVPAQARLALEFRHQSEADLDAMQAALLQLAEHVAQGNGLTLMVESRGSHAAAQMDEAMVAAIEKACTALQLPSIRLISYAGHDAQSMSRITPAAMVFVPSVDGISHNPKEFTKAEDVINGANVMLQTLMNLAHG